MSNVPTSRKSQTDWRRVDALRDEDVDLSDSPAISAEKIARGKLRRGLKPIPKKKLTLLLDSEVVGWFREQGEGYQERINAILREYKEAHQRA